MLPDPQKEICSKKNIKQEFTWNLRVRRERSIPSSSPLGFFLRGGQILRSILGWRTVMVDLTLVWHFT